VSKRDYYEILGVTKTATEVQVKSAYRKLALQHHPDRNPGDAAAEEKFKEAAEAYSVLADAEKRNRYDRFGHAGVSSQGSSAAGFDPTIFADFGDIFGNLGDVFGFGDLFGGGRRRGGAQRGSDLRYDLRISFEESARGVETAIDIPRLESCDTCTGTGAAPGSAPSTCPQCHGRGQVATQHGFLTVARTCSRCQGSGRVITKPCATCKGAGRTTRQRKLTVKIPAGIAGGQQLRLSREGEGGVGGGPAGDLYVFVDVAEHAFFRRDGNDLVCEIPLNFPTLALGGTIDVPTLDGTEPHKIPEGTQSGTTFRIRGKGMPDVSGRGRGDLFFVAQAVTPKKPSKEQRAALEQLAKSLPKDKFEPRPHESESSGDDKNIFERVKDIFG
jgi:molecular chaperone DnaJ